jgi:predicted ATPase/predicted Zn-dependent protease
LLVLDNFEHLLEGVSLVSQILQNCSKLELLITSRERLNLAEEWLLSVAGLSYPTNSEEAMTSDAVTLFLQRAQQVQPTFMVSEEDLLHLLKICHLVGGSPLGIELSAVWVRLMSVADIARELETSLDLLTTSLRNVPERQVSIRATFEHSWKLLTSKEQESLRKLSTFRGGFTREAAAAVAGASIAVLAALVDKSLLRVAANGRYDFHPLVYQYTQEKLAEHSEELVQLRAKYGNYFYTFLSRLQRDIFQKPESLDLVEDEFENIRAALDSFGPLRLEDLVKAFDPLFMFLDLRGRYEEARKLFARVIAGLDESNPQHHVMLGDALVRQACFCHRLGLYEDAHRLTERGLALMSLPEAPMAVLLGYNTLAMTAQAFGNFAEALRHRELASELIQTIKEQAYLLADVVDTTLGVNIHNTAEVEVALGHYAEAQHHYEEALRLNQSLGNVSFYADSFNCLGHVLLLMGKPKEALPYLQDGLELARKAGLPGDIIFAQTYLAATYLELGDVEKALELAQEAWTLAKESELLHAKLETLLVLGKITTKLKDHAQARDYLRQGLELAWTTRETPKLLAVFVGFAGLQLGQGETEKASHLLALVKGHPKTEYRFRSEAQELLGELEKHLSSKAMKERLEGGKVMTLEEAVEVARQLA